MFCFQAQKHAEINAEIGTLLYHLASKIKSQIANRLTLIAKYIAERKLNTTQRVDAALNFVLSNANDDFSVAKFEEACGVGVVVTRKEINEQVNKVIEKNKKDILEKRFALSFI